MFSTATKEAANDTIADAKVAAANVKRDLRDASKDSRNELSAYAEKAGRGVRQAIDSAHDQLSQAGDRVTSEIRNNPIRSSAIALGLGVVVGALMRR